ncbi:hypothetical protein EMCG_00245 [[Emmonsia] crescens]|uniref:Uncharacterized protein n=1 Tax=[Emmonsia] crescens TaxID=73230 RepID=A0A0G2I055_9EURO|nr:hypothetical protein EMCG_00245 [Emmonsia crescens UAMH 3008]
MTVDLSRLCSAQIGFAQAWDIWSDKQMPPHPWCYRRRRVKNKVIRDICYPLEDTMRMFHREELEPIEIIDPCPPEPWQKPVLKGIYLDSDRAKAIERATKILENPTKAVFTDAAKENSALGAAALIMDNSYRIQYGIQVGVGRAKHWTVTTAEGTASHEFCQPAGRMGGIEVMTHHHVTLSVCISLTSSISHITLRATFS